MIEITLFDIFTVFIFIFTRFTLHVISALMKPPPLHLVSIAISSLPLIAGSCGDDDSAVNTHNTSFSFSTAPGLETHWCQYAKLPKEVSGSPVSAISVTGMRWSWENAHHWALYRTLPTLPPNVSLDQPFDCFQPGAMQHASNSSLVLAGDKVGSQVFPEGTGLSFTPGEVVLIQLHSLNVTDQPLTATLKVDFDVADAADIPNPLGLIQFYDPYIVVENQGPARAQMRCQIPSNMTVLGSTTHQHLRGTGVKVFVDPPAGPRASTPILESLDWEHPVSLQEPLTLTANSHVRTVCDYRGDGTPAYQGQNKQTDEMCMFIGYYYPVIPGAQGALFENCVDDTVPGGIGDEYGTGDKSCAQTLGCIQTCSPADAPRPGDGRIDVGACYQRCMVDSCPAASEPLSSLSQCVQTKCAQACNQGGDCGACVAANCGAEFGACQSASCGG